MDDIANHCADNKAATRQVENLRWIVWGDGRRIAHDWAAVHAMALDHGWAFVRIGSCLFGFAADAQEGRA